MNKRAIGADYEEKAAQWLTEEGYEILCRNFRSSYGEIDLVARQGNCLVFVEVKYRKSRGSGCPEEAVSRDKQIRICRTADYYRARNRISEAVPCRFDVLAIEKETVRHYVDAFPYSTAPVRGKYHGYS